MRILIACEYSAVVRDAFRAKGHDAWSCDILPTEGDPKYHYQCDIGEVLDKGWDMMIGHPPCTYLCVAGLHYSKKNPERMKKTQEAINFFKMLYEADIPKIVLENPVGILSTVLRKPDQIVNPYDFGTPERKKTCLWLKGVPKLVSTEIVEVKPLKTITRKSGSKKGQPYNYYWRQGKTAHERSRTFKCIAGAMAEQWG